MNSKTHYNTGFASGGVTCPALAGELCVPHLRDSVLVDPEIFRDAPKSARTQSPKTLETMRGQHRHKTKIRL